jgi:hypothetical protein
VLVLVLGAFSVSAFGLYGRRPAPWPTDTQGRPYESADGTAHGYFEWQRCFRAWQAWMDSPVGRREKQAEIDALIEAALRRAQRRMRAARQWLRPGSGARAPVGDRRRSRLIYVQTLLASDTPALDCSPRW